MEKEISGEYYIKKYAQEILEQIKARNPRINQTKIVERCAEKGLYVTQGTISRAMKEPESMTFATLVKICAGLDLDLLDLFTRQEKAACPEVSSTSEESLFIRDPGNRAFHGYLGNYFSYFYQTTGNEQEIMEGHLTFKPSKDNTRCDATFFLPTGKTNDENREVVKIYSGELLMSVPMRAAYCILYSENEICFFSFSHFHIISEHLRCTMAGVVTVSSGANRRPTMHRMCISDRKITGKELDYIKGQLLLNESDILISARNLEKVKNSSDFSPVFLNMIGNAVQKERYYSISETRLFNNEMSEEELAREISLLRKYSAAGKYNKVSERTNELLYSIINSIPE